MSAEQEKFATTPEEVQAVVDEALADSEPAAPEIPTDVYQGPSTTLTMIGGTTLRVAHSEAAMRARLKRGEFVKVQIPGAPGDVGLASLVGEGFWFRDVVLAEQSIRTSAVIVMHEHKPVEPRWIEPRPTDPYGTWRVGADSPADIKIGLTKRKRWWQR
jgi:hypothetical protein